MGILNKRNAVVGWVAVKVGKRVVKQKAAGAVPSAKTGGAAAGALAAIGGVLFFWRRKRDSGGE
jgi:LPXTG-motif cell wall-anchored protein